MNQLEENRVITLDQIPDNPLAMPPPYWRGSGVIFQLLDALENLNLLLNDLLPVLERTETQLAKYYKKYPTEGENPNLEEFANICDELWMLEHKIKMKAELAIFMSAIQIEDDINRFCVYNLHKDISEAIEELSPPEKLLIAAATVGKSDTKGNAVFEAIKKLTKWRNAYAHGHCVDRPHRSLRHNHLIYPAQYPSVPNIIAEMKNLVEGYIKIAKYLSSISINPYTAIHYVEIEEIEENLSKIARFRFEVFEDTKKILDREKRRPTSA